MATTQFPKPSWYSAEDDTAWGKVKAAFRRDWQQTEHDFGAKVPNLNQQVGDTVSQATGSKPIPPGNVPTPHPASPSTYRDEDEPAYRYGYAAYRHYGNAADLEQDTWTDREAEFEREWQDKNEWERRKEAVRRGWTYGLLERRRVTPK